MTVGSDDSRLAYALADQPTAANPYSPDALTRFSSSGGAVTVTRASVGRYSVRFAGLGRPPGGKDNVQVTGYGGVPIYCKPASWDASSVDLVVQVNCFLLDASPARQQVHDHLSSAPGRSADLHRSVSCSLMAIPAPLSSTPQEPRIIPAGGTIAVGHQFEARYSTLMTGLGQQSGGAAGPAGLLVSGSGSAARRCHVAAYAVAEGGTEVDCNTAGGGIADSPFSLLWFTRGRPGSATAMP